MLENLEQKRSVKFKSIFRQQLDTATKKSVSRKAAAHLEISSPILQHSTSIFSVVSPTRSSFNTDYYQDPFELYQPTSPPPPVPRQQHTPRSSSMTSPTGCKDVHPLEVSNNPMRHADARRTVASDPRVNNHGPEKKKYNRRHSCSSTMPKKEETVCSLTKSLSRKGRHSSNKVGAWSPSAASIEPSASKSMPHKVKTYNVPKKPQDLEKLRKMQELEDLISGRRGSTLKLTLTPKGL